MPERSFKDLACRSTVQKWPTGGCYAPVAGSWVGSEVMVIFPDKTVETRKVQGSEGSSHYIAQIADNYLNLDLYIFMPEALKSIFAVVKRNPDIMFRTAKT